MSLWIPPGASRAMAENREEIAAAYAHTGFALKLFERWNKVLREIDPRLQLILAPENVNLPGIRPGFYHVIREVPGAAPGVFVVEGAEGEFIEPGSYMLERLKASDLWDDRVVRDREKRRKKIAQAAERQREREREDRITEMQERLRSRSGTQVLIS